jgi:hypothetical protein
MTYFSQFTWPVLIILLVLAPGCALIPDEMPQKSAPVGLIATPPSYYSTQKARYLGYKYQENLSRLIEKIVRDPKTANLQFANNIASVGGIGFFTHSAAKVPDERYLEVVLSAPETFEKKGDYSSKFHRLFSLYGSELLTILSGDVDIYREKEVAGYGLDFSWRTIVSEASGPRVVVERAVAYFPKEEVRAFLKNEVVENNFLHDAVIFAAEADGPMNLLSYRQQERKPDFRPPIQEQILAEGQNKPHNKRKPVAAPNPGPRGQADTDRRVEHPENVAKKGTGEPEVPAKTPMLKSEPKASSVKAESASVVPSSTTDLKERAERGAVPEKGPAHQATIRKPSTSLASKAEQSDAQSRPSTAAHGAPEEKTSPATPLSHSPGIQPKATETRVEQQPGAEIRTSSAGGKATPEKAKDAKGLSKEISGGSAAPGATRGTHAVDTRPSSLEAENKSPIEIKPAGGGFGSSAKIREVTKEEVHAPRVASKADAKPVEKKIPQSAPVVAPPKTRPPVSVAPESVHQGQSGEKPSTREITVMEKASEDRGPSRTQTKSDEKRNPVYELAPGRAAVAVEPKEVARPEVPERIKPKIPAQTSPAETTLKPKSETQSIAKGRVEPLPPAAARTEAPVAEKIVPLPPARVEPPPGPVATPSDQTGDKRAGQKLALLTNKSSTNVDERKPPVRAAPKMLKGYIIQIAFMDKAIAQHWAETLERRGYAVSVTKAGSSGLLRVRIGNFPMRHEAERELKSLAKNGLNGIVLNLPDGYRPTEDASKGD